MTHIDQIRSFEIHISYMVKAISNFDNGNNLNLLYSIYLFQDIKAAYKELFMNLKPFKYRQPIHESLESLFNNNKLLIKQNKLTITNFISQNKENCRENSKEVTLQIVRILKQLNFSEKDATYLLTKFLFMNGYFEHLITPVSFPLNAYLSATLSNYKLFTRIISDVKLLDDNNNNFDFSYLINSVIRINLGKFFVYLNKFRLVDTELKPKEQKLKSKVLAITKNLKIYPKLHQLLCEIFGKLDNCLEKEKSSVNYASILMYMKQFRKFLENPLEMTKSKKDIYNMIEIGSTLSLFFYIYGGKNFDYTPSQFKNNSYEITITCFELMNEAKNILVGVTTFYENISHIESREDLIKIKHVFLSIFNVLNVSYFPNHILYNKVYNKLPFVLISTKSIVFIETETFGDLCYKIIKNKNTKNFDSKGENYIIKPKYIFSPLQILIKNFSKSLLNHSYNNLISAEIPYFKDNSICKVNEMIRFFSIFYNYYFINTLELPNEVKFIENFPYSLDNISYDRLNRKYFASLNSKKVSLENGHSIFAEFLNVEMFLYLSLIPLHKNKYINYRCSQFLDFYYKNLFTSIKNIFEKEKNQFDKEKKLKIKLSELKIDYDLFCNEEKNLKIKMSESQKDYDFFCNEGDEEEIKKLKIKMSNLERDYNFLSNEGYKKEKKKLSDELTKIEKMYNSLKEHCDYLEDQFAKYLINFYFTYFNVCSFHEEIYNFNFRLTNSLDTIQNNLSSMNKLLKEKEYFYFSLEVIEFIENNLNTFPAMILCNWIKKLSPFFVLILHIYINPHLVNGRISILSENLTAEETLLIKACLSQYLAYKLINEVDLSWRIEEIIYKFFKIIKYFISHFISNFSPSFKPNLENVNFTLRQVFEVTVYSLIKTLSNFKNIPRMQTSDSECSYVCSEIDCVRDMFLDNSQFYESNMYYYEQKGFNESGNVYFCIDMSENEAFIKEMESKYLEKKNRYNMSAEERLIEEKKIKYLEGKFLPYDIEVSLEINEETIAQNDKLEIQKDGLIDLLWKKKIKTLFTQKPDLGKKDVADCFNYVGNNLMKSEDIMKMIDKIYEF